MPIIAFHVIVRDPSVLEGIVTETREVPWYGVLSVHLPVDVAVVESLTSIPGRLVVCTTLEEEPERRVGFEKGRGEEDVLVC